MPDKRILAIEKREYVNNKQKCRKECHFRRQNSSECLESYTNTYGFWQSSDAVHASRDTARDPGLGPSPDDSSRPGDLVNSPGTVLTSACYAASNDAFVSRTGDGTKFPNVN